ncbi:MAG: hypothetical protein EOO39_42040 [Cytophagaceae bacterium]|nr:MAG: hypothetical protein EOO39_42040 [Cytophagaceae bacterium]
MSKNLTTVLWFDHVGEEAANFYVSLFPDSHVCRDFAPYRLLIHYW